MPLGVRLPHQPWGALGCQGQVRAALLRLRRRGAPHHHGVDHAAGRSLSVQAFIRVGGRGVVCKAVGKTRVLRRVHGAESGVLRRGSGSNVASWAIGMTLINDMILVCTPGRS